jgi:Spy/CpxP family protein refolding chaperone
MSTLLSSPAYRPDEKLPSGICGREVGVEIETLTAGKFDRADLTREQKQQLGKMFGEF